MSRRPQSLKKKSSMAAGVGRSKSSKSTNYNTTMTVTMIITENHERKY